MSQTRQVASPEPVAAYLPVGDWAQQRIGEAWPEDQRAALTEHATNSPLNVALHLPTLRTLNTAWGSHQSSKTSSGEKVGAVEVEAGGASASVKIDELIWTRAGTVVGAEASAFGTRWNE
jgi:hypothetical protein